MVKFNPEKVHDRIIAWIQDWFAVNGMDSNAIIGISGGKDSTITAALLVEALGKDRVIGVLMPNGEQSDIEDARKVVRLLGIKYFEINIKRAYDGLTSEIFKKTRMDLNNSYKTNTPARVRMATLYGIAALYNGRVAETSNYSEYYCGWGTKWGDSCGDFGLLGTLTVTEIRQLGDYMKLPKELVYKTPSDGMSGKSDEEKLGFSYIILDNYIRGKKIDDNVAKQIEKLHSNPNISKKAVLKEEDMFQL